MATAILMRHPQTGIIKTGYYGFSWTSLFSMGLNAFFRGEIGLGFLYIVGNLVMPIFTPIALGFFYNRAYTTRLLQKGYQFCGTDFENEMARQKLKVAKLGL